MTTATRNHALKYRKVQLEFDTFNPQGTLQYTAWLHEDKDRKNEVRVFGSERVTFIITPFGRTFTVKVHTEDGYEFHHGTVDVVAEYQKFRFYPVLLTVQRERDLEA